MKKLLIMVLLFGFCPAPAMANQCNWDQTPGWVKRENLKKGDSDWADGIPLRFSADFSRRKERARIEGFASTTSAGCGETIELTTVGSKNFTAQFYRMGYYKGSGARLVTILKSPREVVVDSTMPPGQYLIKISSAGRSLSFIPLVIKSNSTTEVSFISSVFTWQAYNQWGGKSIYKGFDGTKDTAANSVSFDRPYDGDGAGQFRYMEQPLTTLIEKLGLDVSYFTDYDVAKNPKLLLSAKSIVLGGHSEFWTEAMRQAFDDAVQGGVNLLVFGGNTGYALTQIDGREVVGRTPFRDLGKPESLLLGSQYFALGIKKDLVAMDTWPFSILGNDAVIKSIYGYEADTAMGTKGPGVQILARAVISPTEKGFVAMSTYYRAPSGAAVLNIGTNGWVCAINNRCPWGHSFDVATQKQVQKVTLEILKKAQNSNWPVAQIDIPTRP